MFEEPEMDLLEVLSGDQHTYLYFEEHVFYDDRQRALRSLSIMRNDGMIEITLDGQPIENWRLAAWRRTPESAETVSDLQRVSLWITAAGCRYYWGR